MNRGKKMRVLLHQEIEERYLKTKLRFSPEESVVRPLKLEPKKVL
jgi:hypothetical protein